VPETEPSYDDDDCNHINHTDPIYEEIYNMWRGVDGLMPYEKMELEAEFFTGSDFPGNIHEYNPNPGNVYPVVAR